MDIHPNAYYEGIQERTIHRALIDSALFLMTSCPPRPFLIVMAMYHVGLVRLILKFSETEVGVQSVTNGFVTIVSTSMLQEVHKHAPFHQPVLFNMDAQGSLQACAIPQACAVQQACSHMYFFKNQQGGFGGSTPPRKKP